MASLWKRPDSKFWIACFTDSEGRRLKRSTKCTNRRDALKVAESFEEAARKKSTSRQIRRVFQDLHEDVLGEELPFVSLSEFLKNWQERKQGEVAKTTFSFYRSVAKRFQKFMGERAGQDISDVSPRDIVAFRDAMAESVSNSTANHHIKALRMIFADAKRDGWILDIPTDGVKSLRVVKSMDRRRPFTLPELKALLDRIGDSEWRTLVLLGLYTGQRLGDVASLRWSQVDLEQREISFLTKKTGRRVLVPIADPLFKRLGEIQPAVRPSDPLTPELLSLIEGAGGKTSTLSRQFSEILEEAKLRPPRASKGHEKLESRDAQRKTVEPLSFHSLRHTTVSLMKNAGVSPAIVQDLVGHESAEISAHYTHVEARAKAKALSSMPDLKE